MTQLVKKNCSDNGKNIIMYTIFNGHLLQYPYLITSLKIKKGDTSTCISRYYHSRATCGWLTPPPPPLPYSFQILLHLPKRLVIRMLVWTMVQILNIEHQKRTSRYVYYNTLSLNFTSFNNMVLVFFFLLTCILNSFTFLVMFKS